MANPEHLELLLDGLAGRDAGIWNQWRIRNPTIVPDLSNEDLRDTDLFEFDLSSANLSQSDLSGSECIRTNLIRSNLRHTILKYCNLSGARLNDADMQDANLFGARLFGTELIRVNLSDANLDLATLVFSDLGGSVLNSTYLVRATLDSCSLRDTDFSGSMMGHTNLSFLDLSAAVGIDNILHESRSSIGIETLHLSRFGNNLSKGFLRGVGVPDQMIDNLVLLLDTSIEYHSCFISYSSKNQDFASRLYANLQNSNVRCWLATEDLKIGDKFRTRIEESIRLHDKLLLVLSETSVNSPWVESEVESAMERERKEGKTILFPVMLDNAVMDTTVAWAAEIRRTRHIGDFRDWKNHDSYTKALNRLLSNLKAESNK